MDAVVSFGFLFIRGEYGVFCCGLGPTLLESELQKWKRPELGMIGFDFN